MQQLQTWTLENRYMPELTCQQRASYGVHPLCVNETPPPSPTLAATRTPFPLPTVPQVTFTPIASPTASNTPTPTPSPTTENGE